MNRRPPLRGHLAFVQPAVHGGPDYALYARLGLRPEDVLDFSANANPYGPSPRVAEALARAPLDRYPDSASRALAERLAERHGVAPEQVLVGNGSTELIRLLAAAYLGTGDGCLLVEPTFGEYRAAAELAGASVFAYRTPAEQGFRPGVAAIATLARSVRPRLAYLCNPNNPTGAYLTRTEIEEVLAACDGGLVAVDLAYEPFVAAPWPAEPLLAAGNAVLLHSMTKAEALAGLRLGYLLGPADLVAELQRVQGPWSVNALAQAAGLAALADEGYRRETLAQTAAAAEALAADLRALGLEVLPSATNFMLVHVGDGAACREALLRQGVLVRDCASFGLPAYIRIAARKPDENARLVDALRSIVTADAGAVAGEVAASSPLTPRPLPLEGRVGKLAAPTGSRLPTPCTFEISGADKKVQSLASGGGPNLLTPFPAREGGTIGAESAPGSNSSPFPRREGGQEVRSSLLCQPGGAGTADPSSPSPLERERAGGEGGGNPSLAPVLMVQGTSSSVGKSLLVAGLCRLFRQEGLRVAPFKAQNMSLNSYVTPEGAEIGRAQVVQAQAAGLAPHADMNPILLKPEADARSQVVLDGKPWKSLPAGTYYQHRAELWPHVTGALDRLRARYDLVIVEGAGSPAEINLRPGDIVNMAVALYAQAAVLLAGDIDRGGVFAALLGTLMLLQPAERALVKGLIVNKFRGDIRLLDDGLRMLEERAHVPVLGVVPYLHNLAIAEEDGVFLEEARLRSNDFSRSSVDIAAIHFPHISNFDDLDALQLEPGVRVRWVQTASALGRPAAIVLPGSKNTLDDLAWLRAQGLAEAILARANECTSIAGICGGYQMLGRSLADPHGYDGGQPGGSAEGLGLLPVETAFLPVKATRQVHARIAARQGWLAGVTGAGVTGYEIHMGETRIAGEPLFVLPDPSGGERPDGAVADGGRILGGYLHGLFDTPTFRRAWLTSLGWRGEGPAFELHEVREAAYDRLADTLRESLDVARLWQLVGLENVHR